MSKIFDVESVQILRGQLADEMVSKHYRHYKGGLYIVINVVVKEDTGDIIICYRSLEYGYVWARILADWSSKVPSLEVKGEFVQRFSIVV